VNYLAQDAERIKRALLAGVEVPEDSDDLFLLYAVLLRAKGAAITTADVHDAWSAWMIRRDPEHDAIKPFAELARDVRVEDEPFTEAIRACARAR